MNPIAETLCTECGLCCDGSLFADVELGGAREAARVELLGLRIEDGDGDESALLLQPCGALKERRCMVYKHRPKCCRTFECGLLQEVKRGTISFEDARGKVKRAVAQVAEINALLGRGSRKENFSLKERCQDFRTHTESAVLETALTSLEATIEETFLRGRA
jgi:Fe-S-cluster containining protein